MSDTVAREDGNGEVDYHNVPTPSTELPVARNEGQERSQAGALPEGNEQRNDSRRREGESARISPNPGDSGNCEYDRGEACVSGQLGQVPPTVIERVERRDRVRVAEDVR